MNKTDYIIIGPDLNDDFPQYWDNLNEEWTTDYDKATHYPKSILAGPLPTGIVGIMEVNQNAEVFSFYKTDTLPLPL